MVLRIKLLFTISGLLLGVAWTLFPLSAQAVDLCRCVDHDCRKKACIEPW